MSQIIVVKNFRRKKDKIVVCIMGADYVETKYSLNPSDPLKYLISVHCTNFSINSSDYSFIYKAGRIDEDKNCIDLDIQNGDFIDVVKRTYFFLLLRRKKCDKLHII